MQEIRTYTYFGTDKKWHYIARRFEEGGDPNGVYHSYGGDFDSEEAANAAARDRYPDATHKVVELGSNDV